MSEYAEIKSSLETKLSELLERAESIESVLSDPGNSDWEENAIETENDEALSAIGDVTKDEIRDIKLALHRIEHGQYGICTSCGKKIAKARLAALPWTNTCVGCA